MVERKLSHSAAISFGSPEHLTVLTYNVLSAHQRYDIFVGSWAEKTLYFNKYYSSLTTSLACFAINDET